jgi:tryptophan-rich sensory protein
MVGIFPSYSYCYYIGEIYVIVHILVLFSLVLVFNQSTIMNDKQLTFLYAFMKIQEAWQEVDPDEYSYEASYIACSLILSSPSSSFEASYINM